MGFVHATHMAEPSQAIPLYLLPNSGLFLAVVADHVIMLAIASGHPEDLSKAAHLENLQFCQVGCQEHPEFGSVQKVSDDDGIEDLHLRC